MLILYYKPTCPFCRRVTAVIDRLGLEVEMKDISADEAVAAELEEKGGHRRVPYLVDTDKDVAMYESDDIVTHLQKEYGEVSSEPNKPRVHVGGGTCVASEG